MVPEVLQALRDFAASKIGGVVIGGLSIGVHARPRTTMDVDVLFLCLPVDIRSKVLDKFKMRRDHALTHKATGVEVEVLDARFLNLPDQLVNMVIDTAHHDPIGLLVASVEGIIALKLQRGTPQDRADIFALISAQGVRDMSEWPLKGQQMDDYRRIVNEFRDPSSVRNFAESLNN